MKSDIEILLARFVFRESQEISKTLLKFVCRPHFFKILRKLTLSKSGQFDVSSEGPPLAGLITY